MLLVGNGRQERLRSGPSGFRFGEMEETEFEEGEARSETGIDPDVDFSHIDEKIEEVLGDIREGGVFADNLDAKFNGYGSFLDIYQPSRLFGNQTRTPSEQLTRNRLTSPFNSSVKGARISPSIQPRTSVVKSTFTPSTSQYRAKSRSKEECGNAYSDKESVCESKPYNGPNISIDHKRLKVRIKVGSDSTAARDKASIYSGLGLDISPPSSSEEMFDGSESASPEFGGLPNETPSMILQIMTFLPIPEEHVLSPLHISLSCLKEKQSPPSRNKVHKHAPEVSSRLEQHVKDEGSDLIKVEPNESKSRPIRSKSQFYKYGTSTTIIEEFGFDTPVEVVANEPNFRGSPGNIGLDVKREEQLVDESIKVQDTNRRFSSINKQEKESSRNLDMNKSSSEEKEDTYRSRDLKGRSTLSEKVDIRKTSDQKTARSNDYKLDNDRAPEADEANEKNPEGYKTGSNHSADTEEVFTQKPAKKVVSSIEDVEKIFDEDDHLLERSKKSRESHASRLQVDISAGDMMDLSPVSVGKNKGISRSKHSESISRSKKSHKEPNPCNGEEPHKSMLEGMETHPKSDRKDVEFEKEKPKDGLDESKNHDPVLVEDNWVLCDRCQKWRLLPYGTNPDHLPKKWRCKMLSWLPGMNNCNISEEETTKALYALYQLPVPDNSSNLNTHPDVAASTVTSTDGGFFNKNVESAQNVPKVGKKKPAANSASIVQSAANRVSSSSRKVQDGSARAGGPDDLDQINVWLETSKKGEIEGSKSFKCNVEDVQRQQKRFIDGHSDEGDFLEQSGKTLKLKSKRKTDQNGSISFKKMKPHAYSGSDSEAYKKPADWGVGSGSSVKSSLKNLQNGYSSLKDSSSKLQNDNFSGTKNPMIQGHAFSSRELKKDQDTHDIKNHDEISGKKRKANQKDSLQLLMENHHPHDEKVKSREQACETDKRKVKKSKLSKPDAREYSRVKSGDRVDEIHSKAEAVLLSGEGNHKKEVETGLDDHKQRKASHKGAARQQAVNGISYLDKGTSTRPPSTASGANHNYPSNLGNKDSASCQNGIKLNPSAVERKDRAETTNAGVKSEKLPSTGDGQARDRSVRGSMSEVPHAVNGNNDEVTKDQKTFDSQKKFSSSKLPATSDVKVHTSVKKDSHTANAVLKEARGLKHTADRLKNDGHELESTSLYFQAALKYLHGASLLEPCNLEGDRHGEVTQSMAMYSDTAKLCEFCAHEFERCKEMAAAALAYKCVEVAYFKVAYYRHPIASKDRQELQATLSMHPLGESPSSSASDLDNQNNGSSVDKVTATKGIHSPLVAGNKAIAGRNPSNLTRLLDYMSETIFAFEASRKSHNAIAAANGSLEKYGKDGLTSVRTVLDLSFHNIQELLRLVRLSIESIKLETV